MASPSQPPVHPLRILKGTSPTKGNAIPRPLSEIAPSEHRRNSPSFNQATKKMAPPNVDSSPFQSSPFNASADGNSSPRVFWQGRDPKSPSTQSRFNSENNLFGGREASPSPTRRSSIERLQKASRVKNSNMFAREQKQEYDPTSVPIIERPLAKQIQGNAYGGTGLEGFRSAEKGRPVFGHNRNDSQTSIPLYSPTKIPLRPGANGLCSPSKEQLSPTKSAMASRPFTPKSSLDLENVHYADECSLDEDRELPAGKALHRHAKSVTFDAAPPQVNEYEMATPDLSSIGTGSRENSYDSAEDEDEDSYNRGESMELDDSFDASLEDTDKTPVVGPEDWRHASPNRYGNGIISGQLYDPFDGPESSPMPDARPTSSIDRPNASRADSGDHRPLPPLPAIAGHARSNSTSSIGLSAAAERASSRNMPSPPGAGSVSKSDIQGMNGEKMTLEEKLRLMMIQVEEKPKTIAEQQRERRMRRGVVRDRNSHTPECEQSVQIHEDEIEDEDTLDDLPGLDSYQLPPRISRESILRKVNGQDAFARESDYNFSSPMPSSSPERAAVIDPDTPLPSTEDQSVIDDDDDSIIIKPEPEDDVDLYSITDMYQKNDSSTDGYDEPQIDTVPGDDDTESQYSDPGPFLQNSQLQSNSAPEDDSPATPRATEFVAPTKKGNGEALPELKGFLSTGDFGQSLQSYMSTPSPKETEEPELPTVPVTAKLQELPTEQIIQGTSDEHTSILSAAHEYSSRPETPQYRALPSLKPEYDGTGWGTDEEDDEMESSTPESVIRHALPSSPPRDSPAIPENVATIKASGSMLKTRPSATPADMEVLRGIRRQVSGETRDIPPIPDRHRNRPSVERELAEGLGAEAALERQLSLKKRSLTVDIGSDLDFSLDKDFDRVMEAQKVPFDLSPSRSAAFLFYRQASDHNGLPSHRSYANITPRQQRGYLMRQNTKVVVASSDVDKGTRSAGNSPVKMQRPQSWTVEPWNGQVRQNIVRENSSPRKKAPQGSVPPMPGYESNVHGLAALAEDAPEPILDESGERGRLFVKVMGVKDLDLPLPKSAFFDMLILRMNSADSIGEQSWFSLTLDNGVHCVTTAWLELGRNAPIGQEFELVVPNELEFQLTLNAKLVKPPPKRVVESFAKKVQKPSTFSRVFTSPKKRKELELKQKQEEQQLAERQQRDAQAKRASTQPTTWDLLSPLAAEDGSFGRSYVCLKDHETRCYGRPYVVDVACFNEWATEEANFASSGRSKRGNTHTQRRAPYKIAKLELQLLFVPKPKGATDEDMPKSMNSCIREMKEAEIAVALTFEGHLSQQGGDCPYWRRRFFKLNGSKLTAYHESTRQPRATINLSNASKLIDDRRALTQKETTAKGGKRRRSGFAEEEEGYMFVEEGFRIRFNNGEVIDFYADTAADKESWMKVLDACVAKESDGSKSSWSNMVLKREANLLKKAEGGRRHHSRTKSTII
ncbi:putative Bud site selection protein BUD4 [Calycina marina]|uniref:Bud site selection protein BUD4 n=1 Tax=Calycina marina TaxID=1763456 RepID=A0A9P8CBL9_9HELO|nr:putative Bud site selection protein BUD4 [Calycina marina]